MCAYAFGCFANAFMMGLKTETGTLFTEFVRDPFFSFEVVFGKHGIKEQSSEE